MHHALFGGDSLTANLSQVADLPGVWLSLHEECVALRHWLASMRRLADPQSPLYALRDRLHGYRADGGQRPGRLTTADVDFIVNWAGGFAAQYFPSEMGGKAAADAAGVVCNETPPHRLLDLLVYNRSGLRWAGHDVMFVGFNGRPVVIEAWMADALASALTTHRVLARRLAAIAQLFSLSVATGTLLGPESDICAVAVRSH
ncbi:hypothetical protein JNJ66_04370 [Candidatus Saccharibacteria bacterium]|nr:hypothetical protein [Candidatus Saccharibacteria bacterium]